MKTMIKGLFLLMIVCALAPNAAAQANANMPSTVNASDAHIVKRGVVNDTIPVSLRGLSDGYGDTNSILNYQYFEYYYPSIDADGNYVALSALAAFPYTKGENGGDKAPTNLCIGCHITITDDAESPTGYIPSGLESLASDIFMFVKHAATGDDDKYYKNCLVIMPDYQGYGHTKSSPHPYLYEELTARQVVDAVRYGLALFLNDDMETDDGTVKRSFASDTWKSFAVGYSQGGAVAMATHKFIETNNLSSELHFLGSVCGDGPYDPVATVRWYIDQGKVYMPVVLPLILKGMVDANPYMKKHTVSQYLTDSFLATGILDMLEDKSMNTDDITEALLDCSASDDYDFVMYTSDGDVYTGGFFQSEDNTYAKVEDLFKPAVLSYLRDDSNFTNADDLVSRTPSYRGLCTDLHKALESNNLTVGWKPSHRMVLFHSDGDEVVPYVNVQSALNKFKRSSNTMVKHIRFTDSDEDDTKHKPVGTTFYWKTIGTSYEQDAVNMLFDTYSNWYNYGNDDWTE